MVAILPPLRKLTTQSAPLAAYPPNPSTEVALRTFLVELHGGWTALHELPKFGGMCPQFLHLLQLSLHVAPLPSRRGALEINRHHGGLPPEPVVSFVAVPVLLL